MHKAGTEIQIGRFRLKNRITMAPTVKFGYTDDSGLAREIHVKHYGDRARGGFGLICVEATAVLPGGRFGRNHMGLWNDAQAESQKAIVEACKAYGSVVIIQLNHVGCGAHPDLGEHIGPSEMDLQGFMGPYHCKGLSIEELKAMQKAYVDAAKRAQQAGYDGVQLHGCHGYLINQFVSVTNNRRTDEYGGDAVNRARFCAEIIAEIRKECGPDFLISVRTTGMDPTVEDAILVAEEYVKAGCDYLQVSTGMTALDSLKPIIVEGTEVDGVNSLGVRFHEHFKGRVPVSCVGGIKTAEHVHFLLDNALTDTVDLGREALAFPDFADAVIHDKEYVSCFGCARCIYGPGNGDKCPAAELAKKKNL